MEPKEFYGHESGNLIGEAGIPGQQGTETIFRKLFSVMTASLPPSASTVLLWPQAFLREKGFSCEFMMLEMALWGNKVEQWHCLWCYLQHFYRAVSNIKLCNNCFLNKPLCPAGEHFIQIKLGREGIERTSKFKERAVHSLCRASADLGCSCVSVVIGICYLHITPVKWAEVSRTFGIFCRLKAKMSVVVWMCASVMVTQYLELIQKGKWRTEADWV